MMLGFGVDVVRCGKKRSGFWVGLGSMRFCVCGELGSCLGMRLFKRQRWRQCGIYVEFH